MQPPMQEGMKELKTQVDLGGEVFCQARVPDTSRVCISIGAAHRHQFRCLWQCAALWGVCVCVCARARACVCVYVCVRRCGIAHIHAFTRGN